MVDVESVTRLRGVIGKLSRQLNATATGEGLTPTQASVLGLVASRDTLGLAELTQLEGLNPTMLSRVVGKLADLGLIRRVPDPDDQRAVRVEITPAGSRLHRRLRAVRTDAVSRCLEELPDEAVKTLLGAVPALEVLAEELKRRRS